MDDRNIGFSLTSWIGNGVSGAAIISALMGLLPIFAASVALIWYFIQIYESKTVQHWLAMRRTRKLARLQAKVLMMVAQSKPPLPGPEDGGHH